MKQPLSEDILNSGVPVILTIVASVGDTSALESYAVVIISLPEEEESPSIGKYRNRN